MALKGLLSFATEPHVADVLQPVAFSEDNSGDDKCDFLDRACMPLPYIKTGDPIVDP